MTQLDKQRQVVALLEVAMAEADEWREESKRILAELNELKTMRKIL